MKLIIDIPDKDYEKLKDGHIPFSILDVMQNGTPLVDVLNKIRAKLMLIEGMEDAIEIIDKYRNEVSS